MSDDVPLYVLKAVSRNRPISLSSDPGAVSVSQELERKAILKSEMNVGEGRNVDAEVVIVMRVGGESGESRSWRVTS
ncbi:hypothetical protein J6590_009818 [Homalodisca vitripennis]|nr:hypothetical protein J6590_009818 [Homalodisca vitripennis]